MNPRIQSLIAAIGALTLDDLVCFSEDERNALQGIHEKEMKYPPQPEPVEPMTTGHISVPWSPAPHEMGGQVPERPMMPLVSGSKMCSECGKYPEANGLCRSCGD